MIKHIEVYNYHRIVNSTKKPIVIDITTPLCVIIGTNGSGKSSLLELLSPYLIKANTLLKGGYVKMVIHHKDSVYNLSVDADSGTHSIIKDGIEINQNGLYTTYCNVIAEEFIEKNIYQTLIGTSPDTTLSGMPVQARKSLLHSVSKTDYALLNTLFDGVKKKLAYNKSVLKYEQGRLIDSNGDDITPESIKDVSDYLAMLDKKITKLDKIRNLTRGIALNITEEGLAYRQNELVSMAESKDDLLTRISWLHDELLEEEMIPQKISRDDVVESTLRIKADRARTLNNITRINLEIEDILSLLKEFNSVELVNLKTEKDNALSNIVDNINNLVTGLNFKYSQGREYQSVYKMLLDLRTPLSNMFSIMKDIVKFDNIPSDLIPTFDRAVIECENAKTRQQELIRKHEEVTASLAETETQCPECKTVFNTCSYSPKFATDLTNEIDSLAETIKAKESYIRLYEEMYEVLVRYNQTVSQLHSLASNYPALDEFFKAVLSSISELSNIPTLGNVLESYLSQYKIMSELDQLYKDKAELESLLSGINEALDKGSSINIGALKDKVEDLVSNRTMQECMLEFLSTKEATAENLKREFDSLLNLQDDITDKLNSYDKDVELFHSSNVNTILSKELRALNDENAGVRAKLHSLETSYDRVNEIKKVIADSSSKIDLLTELSLLMSPNKGFIGYTIRVVLNAIVRRVNLHIEKVWETPLELLELSVGKTIDYKFPVTVNNSEPSIVSRINKASTNVINFFFKIVLAELMNLPNYPIYIDELGDGFDETHRRKIFSYIEDTILTSSVTMFLVSHHAENYTMFDDNHTTYIVLDDGNIDIDNLTGNVIVC